MANKFFKKKFDFLSEGRCRIAADKNGSGFFYHMPKQSIIYTLIFSVIVAYLLSMSILVLKNFFINYPPYDGYILKNESLMGGDFIAFYTGGKLARTDRDNLYNFQAQKKTRNEILRNEFNRIKGELPFVYPPLVAAFFSLFSYLTFDLAFYFWTFFSIFISLSSLFTLSYYLKILTFKSFFSILLSICGFIPYSLDCLAGGQLSTVAIFIFTFLFILIKERKFFFAGLLLSLGYYKPPLFLFFSLVAIFFLNKRFFFGCITGAFLLTFFSIWYTGFSGFLDYLSVASNYRYGQELFDGIKLPPDLGMGIFALATTISPSTSFSLVVYIICFIGLYYSCLKFLLVVDIDKENFDLAYVFLMVSSLALSFQIINYDLSILLPTFIIVAPKIEKINNYKNLISLTIILFYFEWMFRKIQIFGFLINISSILFLLFLTSLFLFLSLDRSGKLNFKSYLFINL